MEVTQHNGNTFNTAFQEMGGTGLAYGDDGNIVCPICEKDPSSHRILETKNIAAICAEIIKKLQKLDYPDGFMVAVASCKCNKILVGTSGDTPAYFETIARSSGANVVVLDSVISLLAMSEMMYSPSKMDRWQKWYDLRVTIAGTTSKIPFHNQASRILDEPKGVASCHTCQILLPMMLCDKDRSC